MSTRIYVDPKEFPQLDGQELGRELELEMTVVVTALPKEGYPPLDPPIDLFLTGLELTIVRVDITQTT